MLSLSFETGFCASKLGIQPIAKICASHRGLDLSLMSVIVVESCCCVDIVI